MRVLQPLFIWIECSSSISFNRRLSSSSSSSSFLFPSKRSASLFIDSEKCQKPQALASRSNSFQSTSQPQAFLNTAQSQSCFRVKAFSKKCAQECSIRNKALKSAQGYSSESANNPRNVRSSCFIALFPLIGVQN